MKINLIKKDEYGAISRNSLECFKNRKLWVCSLYYDKKENIKPQRKIEPRQVLIQNDGVRFKILSKKGTPLKMKAKYAYAWYYFFETKEECEAKYKQLVEKAIKDKRAYQLQMLNKYEQAIDKLKEIYEKY